MMAVERRGSLWYWCDNCQSRFKQKWLLVAGPELADGMRPLPFSITPPDLTRRTLERIHRWESRRAHLLNSFEGLIPTSRFKRTGGCSA